MKKVIFILLTLFVTTGLFALPLIKITINGNVYNATLTDDIQSKQLLKLLPLECNFVEYAPQNEFYAKIPEKINYKKAPVTNCKNGDILLSPSFNALCFIYADFTSKTEYIRFGSFDNVENLKEILQKNNGKIKIEMAK